MIYRFCSLIVFLVLFTTQVMGQNVANYKISAKLNADSKIITGSQILTWTNTTSHPTKELQFHTYLNAFKDLNTTFMIGSGGTLRSDHFDTTQTLNFGYINIHKILFNEKSDLTHRQTYIQPDNLNKNDQTVLKVDLPRKILPGETITISFEFTSKLPKVFARTGWAANDYFLVGQWFPKIGVLENDGSWNCHQFHANTEFYANFGSYQVDITVPKNFIVGATGQKTSEIPLKDQLKQLTFSADSVHDFAWAASPHFVEYSEKYKGKEIKVLMQSEQKYLNKRYFVALKNAIDYLEEHVGPYPHPVITLIDPSSDGSGSGGMEYPTFITGASNWGIGKWFKYQELVTIHEFTHQYFQGMLASNEFEHSWLDEGFTQYFENRIMTNSYPGGSMLSFTSPYSVSSLFSSRFSYVTMSNPKIAPVMMNAWQYPGGSYPILTYTKPATILATLENILGQELMDKIIKTYFKNFKFKHPTPKDFFNTANEVVKKSGRFADLNWFFDQTFREARVCDYTVKNLKNEKGSGSVQLINLGNMKIPVKVKITFLNGKSETINWDGSNKKVSYPFEIETVQIDPEQVNLLDLNLANNSITIKKQAKVQLSLFFTFIFWIQNLMV